jgi:hypothetical protein
MDMSLQIDHSAAGDFENHDVARLVNWERSVRVGLNGFAIVAKAGAQLEERTRSFAARSSTLMARACYTRGRNPVRDLRQRARTAPAASGAA